jgi:phage-related protein
VPPVRIVLYRESDGSVPLLDWLAELATKARAKCRVRLERLAELGHELRRPEADYLRDGVFELRAKHAGVNYRILYFFRGTQAAVVSHGFSKQEARVPSSEIELALLRKRAFGASPEAHTYEEDAWA